MFGQFMPNFGRWMTPDPLAGDVSNPQSLNRYAYVLNNPTSLVDPLGLCDNGAISQANGVTTVTVCGDGAQAPTTACQMAGDGGASCQTALDAAEAAAAQAAAHASGTAGFSSASDVVDMTSSVIFKATSVCAAIPGCPGTIDATAGALAIGGGAACAVAEPCGGIAAGVAGAALYVGSAVATGTAIYWGYQIYQARKADLAQMDEAIRRIERICGKTLNKDQRRWLHDEVTGLGFGIPDIVRTGVGMFCPEKSTE